MTKFRKRSRLKLTRKKFDKDGVDFKHEEQGSIKICFNIISKLLIMFESMNFIVSVIAN